MSAPAGSSAHRLGVVGLACLAGLLLLAVWNRFVQDDAFISFRYAANLAAGHGVVWNPGEAVEGYTNFLWVLIVAGGMRLGIEPVAFSMAVGIGCLAVTLALTYRLAGRLLRSRGTALLAVILLGTNFTFSSYATGGLATQLQTCLFVAATYLLLTSLREATLGVGRAALLSLLLGVAVLTRLDSAVLCAVVVPASLAVTLREDRPASARAAAAAALLIPLGAIVSGWFLWKLRTYGDVFPNTYYLKAASTTSPARGLYYVGSFFAHYGLIALPVVLLAVHRRVPESMRVRLRHPATPVVVLVALWLAYVVKVGGDFMEYRFLVPVLPFVYVWVAGAVLSVPQPAVRVALVAILTLLSWQHSREREIWGMEAIPELDRHVALWAPIGKRLGEQLDRDPTVTIATTAAGAIPYYSGLRTIDLLGLNDREVARNGAPLREAPWYGLPAGHSRIARLEYLLDTGVNLLLNHPWVVSRNDERSAYTLAELNRWRGYDLRVEIDRLDRLPAGARILEIPIDAERALVALYLTPHPRVDAAAARDGWRSLPVVDSED